LEIFVSNIGLIAHQINYPAAAVAEFAIRGFRSGGKI
jgi:hypothetical protein